MFKRKKIDTTLTEAKSDGEAITYLFIGLKWFLIKHTKKTIIALLIISGATLFVVIRYFYKPSGMDKHKTEQVIQK
jgi:hypothetical protein